MSNDVYGTTVFSSSRRDRNNLRIGERVRRAVAHRDIDRRRFAFQRPADHGRGQQVPGIGGHQAPARALRRNQGHRHRHVVHAVIELDVAVPSGADSPR